MSDSDTAREPSDDIRRAAALQRIIDELVADGPNHSAEELAARLVATLRDRGLPVMPKPWIHAVAESAAAGNPYVLSQVTAQTQDVPPPATPTPPYGIQ